jgi:hypothetical protein
MFIPVNTAGNVCVFSSLGGDIVYFTILEPGVLKVHVLGRDGMDGDAFINISRFEGFNYKCANTKEELAKFIFKNTKSLFQTKNYISGNYYSEISFVIEKKMFSTSLRVKRELQSNFPTQISL